MKPDETPFKAKKKYVAVMIVCFLYGGFALASFLLQAYTVFWQTEIIGFPFVESRLARLEPRDADFNRFLPQDSNGFGGARPGSSDPLAQLTSPAALLWLVGGIVSILAGVALWKLTREKEIKSIKEQTTNSLLLPDEKAVIGALKKSDYEMTQAKLAKQAGLSKVQVHRAIKRLESKGVLEKHGYGLTNKIILKKELFE